MYDCVVICTDNFNRVELKMIPEKEPYSDYINASYIDVRHTLDNNVLTTPDSILCYTGLQEKTSVYCLSRSVACYI